MGVVLASFPEKRESGILICMPTPKTSFDGHKEATQFALIVIIALMAGLGFAATRLSVLPSFSISQSAKEEKTLTSNSSSTDEIFPFRTQKISERVFWMSVHDAEPGLYGTLRNRKNIFINISEPDPDKAVKTYTIPFDYEYETDGNVEETGTQDGYLFRIRSSTPGPLRYEEYYNQYNGDRVFAMALGGIAGDIRFMDTKRTVHLSLQSDCDEKEFSQPREETVEVTGLRLNDSFFPFVVPKAARCSASDIGGPNYIFWPLDQYETVKFDGTKNKLLVKLPWGETAVINLLALDISGSIAKGVEIIP